MIRAAQSRISLRKRRQSRSDMDRLAEDSRLELFPDGVLEHQVHLPPDGTAQEKLQLHVVVEGLVRLVEFHEDVDVAALFLQFLGIGAEHGQIDYAKPFGQPFPTGLQYLKQLILCP